MLNPYFLMVLLYVSLAALAAFASALTSFNLLPWFNGLRWLRVHLITLGTLTELAFGLLPALVAAHSGLPRPKTRWATWLSLNAGLLILLAGIPLVNGPLIVAGGGLVFAAVFWLFQQLYALRPTAPPPILRWPGPAGRPFYLAGLTFLLLGVFAGTGLWQGWGALLRMASPLEVHVHANIWGFTSLVLAGLLMDLSPGFARPAAGSAPPRRAPVWPILGLMSAGALALVLGPWLAFTPFTVIGIVLYLSGTFGLLFSLLRPLAGAWRQWGPGLWHLLTAPVWLLAPVLIAPLAYLLLPGLPPVSVSQGPPQALIYGWALPVGYALIPYIFARVFLPDQPARLGGSWFSLAAAHLGSGLFWASLLVSGWQAPLYGAAYICWGAALTSMVWVLWCLIRAGWTRLEASRPAWPDAPADLDE